MNAAESEQLLRETLAGFDQLRATEDEAALAALATAESAQATAGQEFDADILQAEQDVAQSEADYQQQLDTLDQSIQAAQTGINAIEEPDSAADEIDAIGGVDPVDLANSPSITNVTITTGGTPDASAADIATAINQGLANVVTAVNTVIGDIETKVNAAIGQLNTELSNIVIALTVLDENLTALSIDQIKASLQAVKNGVQATRAIAGEPLDVEAEKAAFNSIVNGMFS